ncbi:hypothetical protein C8R46DRAFT_73263 [Mycena filopes]|nr:hypothetical protein C8R46DRAFT_73263 [Mycena filopes]
MLPATDSSVIILVTGGNGFIGSHVVQRFLARGNRVRVVDIAAKSRLEIEPCPRLEVSVGNLLDKEVCSAAVDGVHTILHFAANMGGMGTIHCDNDFRIYLENHNMTLNLLSAATAAGVKQFLYASSACVYPESLQNSTETDVSLREEDVWRNPPPRPQGLYGLDKLTTEMLLVMQQSTMSVFIPRLHNVYGPGGAWHNGREKAPASLLRKAIATAKLLDSSSPSSFEIWGTGQQRRSFLWIGDCVDAVLKLLESDYSRPVNIGSAEAVSIQNLAEIALTSVGVEPARVRFENGGDTKLVGVASRNSNNEFSKQLLNWEPKTPLEVGMRRTGEWIERQMVEQLSIRGAVAAQMKESFLMRCLKSKVLTFGSGVPIFAILLPVTSRGSSKEGDCLANLESFAASLVRTTLNDVFSNEPRFGLRVYVAIDEDDDFLLDGNKVETILRQYGIPDVYTSICSFPRGHVCSLWRHLARKAWQEECSYFALMGDDVTLEDEDWMLRFHNKFAEIAHTEGVPLGFGCVAFTDSTFRGMPTFPVVHRTHMDIFQGTVVPEEFVNQDGDPYLFQLYRRWGCSSMIEPKVRNLLGGSNDARYEKIHAPNWTFDTLHVGASTVEKWLHKQGSPVEQKVTLDIVIPCYPRSARFTSPDAYLGIFQTMLGIDDSHRRRSAVVQYHRLAGRVRGSSRCAHPCQQP